MAFDKTTELTKEQLEKLVTKKEHNGNEYVNIKVNDMIVGTHMIAEILEEPTFIYFFDNKVIEKEEYKTKQLEIEELYKTDKEAGDLMGKKLSSSGKVRTLIHGRKYGWNDFEVTVNCSFKCATKLILDISTKKLKYPCMAFFKKTKYGNGFPQFITPFKKQEGQGQYEPKTKAFEARTDTATTQPTQDNKINPMDYKQLVKFANDQNKLGKKATMGDYLLYIYNQQDPESIYKFKEFFNDIMTQLSLEDPEELTIEKLKDLIKQSGEVQYDLFKDAVEKEYKLKESIFESMISKLLENGEIFEVRAGYYKVLE